MNAMSAAANRAPLVCPGEHARLTLRPASQSIACFARNARPTATNINATRIATKIHVWFIQLCSDDAAEPPAVETAVAPTDRATVGVENGVLELNDPVSVTLAPSSSFVCRTA